MIDTAARAGIVLGVVSQHRFDDASQFLTKAIPAGRLGKLIQCDAYVKWHRSDAYYSRPIKGSWATEGGGALINQAIHQVDLLRWLVGPVRDVAAMWQIGATHKIESEDVVSALLRYENGATGVIQASTSIRPGLSRNGSSCTARRARRSSRATGSSTWDVPKTMRGEPAPVATNVASGASDPMAISLTPFERQFTRLRRRDSDRRAAARLRRGRLPGARDRRAHLQRLPVQVGGRACFHSFGPNGDRPRKMLYVEDPGLSPKRAKTVENRPVPQPVENSQT